MLTSMQACGVRASSNPFNPRKRTRFDRMWLKFWCSSSDVTQRHHCPAMMDGLYLAPHMSMKSQANELLGVPRMEGLIQGTICEGPYASCCRASNLQTGRKERMAQRSHGCLS